MATKKTTKKTTKKVAKKVFKEVAKKTYATLTIKQLSYLAFKLGCIDITKMDYSEFDKRFSDKRKDVIIKSLGKYGTNGVIFECNKKKYCILEQCGILNYV